LAVAVLIAGDLVAICFLVKAAPGSSTRKASRSYCLGLEIGADD
jgi:hypothetical protein